MSDFARISALRRVQAQQNTEQSKDITFKNCPRNQGDYYVFFDTNTECLWFFPKKITSEHEKIIENLFNYVGKKTINNNIFKLKKPAQIYNKMEYNRIFRKNEHKDLLKEGFIWTIRKISEKGEIEW